jgi:phage tail sheath protein FI
VAVGVLIQRTAAAGPPFPEPRPSAQAFFVGLAERGPAVDVVRVTSLADFEAHYGVRPSYGQLYDCVATFFSEGGGAATIARTVGPAATEGSLATPLGDRAGTPVPTLQITARGPGAWSANVTVAVANGTVPNTFTLSVSYLGIEVERYANMPDPQTAVARTSGSQWVKVADLASATTAPNNNPAVTVSPVALAAGTDDRAAVNAAVLVAALGRFGAQLGDGAVAIPGGGDSTHAGLITHAMATNRTALLASAKGSTSTQLATLANSLNSEYAGLFAPWINVRDAYGGLLAIPPEGYVAAVRARAHREVGPWQAPAGERARSKTVVSPDQTFDSVTAAALEDAKVSPILPAQTGVRLYGWRSLSSDTDNWRLLTGIEVINRIVVAAGAELDPLVFSAIDAKGHLLSRVEGALQGIVAPMAAAGGLYPWIELAAGSGQPVQLDPGYSITTDSTREVASANKVIATLAVRISPTAALIQLTVTKVGVTRRF